jgi:hypothetical protein
MSGRVYIKGIIGSFIFYFCLALNPASPLYAEDAKPEQKDAKPVTTKTAKSAEEKNLQETSQYRCLVNTFGADMN